MSIEEGRARATAARAMARALMASCRANRDRVVAAKEFLDKHREILNHDDLQQVLVLMLKVLKEHETEGPTPPLPGV